jgi:hypothetical protein
MSWILTALDMIFQEYLTLFYGSVGRTDRNCVQEGKTQIQGM